MHNREFKRVAGKTEEEDREAAGFWKAIALANELGEDSGDINLDLILEIHRCILEQANPEAAGRFRIAGEDINPLQCIEPPLGSQVHKEMHLFAGDLKYKLGTIPTHSPKPTNKKAHHQWVDSVFDLAAWVQHKIVAIHPFCNGNGRSARLMTNIILRKFGMPSSIVKIEAEDKDKYLSALCQVDMYSDYKPLRDMILKGSLATLRKEKKRRMDKSSA